MQVRKLRLLRLKYHISLVELGRTSGLTPQRISELELSTGKTMDATAQKLLNGIEQIIQQRQQEHDALENDYLCYKDSLMELVGVADYGL